MDIFNKKEINLLKEKISTLENDLKRLREKKISLDFTLMLNDNHYTIDKTGDLYYLAYKGNGFLKFTIDDDTILIKKIEKTNELRNDNIFASDIYIMLIRKLNLRALAERHIYLPQGRPNVDQD